MATSYTYIIEDAAEGKRPAPDLREYMLRCARAFGACADQRDESMDQPPEQKQVDSFYLKDVRRRQKELAAITKMTSTKIEAGCRQHNADELVSWEAECQRRAALKTAYTTMISSVEGWQPPTPDHIGLKEFALEQLATSIEFARFEPDERPTPILPSAWHADCIESALRAVTWAEGRLEVVVKNNHIANTWITALETSLDPLVQIAAVKLPDVNTSEE